MTKKVTKLAEHRAAKSGLPPGYHAVFTDSPQQMLDAEATHRAHAVVEQVIADLKAGPLAHLPSGVFTANAAWLALATIAFNASGPIRPPSHCAPTHSLALARALDPTGQPDPAGAPRALAA